MVQWFAIVLWIIFYFLETKYHFLTSLLHWNGIKISAGKALSNDLIGERCSGRKKWEFLHFHFVWNNYNRGKHASLIRIKSTCGGKLSDNFGRWLIYCWRLGLRFFVETDDPETLLARKPKLNPNHLESRSLKLLFCCSFCFLDR